MKRNGKAFIDANIIIHAESFQKADVFCWIHNLYEEIYVHKTVLDELIAGAAREKTENFIETGQWVLFDPEDEHIVSDERYSLL